MRILSIGNFLNPSWDGSLPDEEHIAQELEFLDHEVIRQQRETGWDEPLPNVDFILIAQWDGYPETALQNIPTPVVYWAFDHQDQNQEWHQRLIQVATLYLSKRIADSKYPNWQWLSQDFAPELLRSGVKEPISNQDIDVLFTGSYLPWADERNETLKLVDENFDLHIYSVNPAEWISRGFKHVNGPVMDEGLHDLIPRAKINLSIDHTIEAGYWSDRNAQIMMCNGLVLFRYIPLSEGVFKNKVDYFYNKDDCLERIAYWLAPRNQHEAHLMRLSAGAYANYFLGVKSRVHDLLTIVKGIL